MSVFERIEAAKKDESGFTTAELLGNAALGVVAIIAIWTALNKAGVGIVEDITDKLRGEIGGSGGGE